MVGSDSQISLSARPPPGTDVLGLTMTQCRKHQIKESAYIITYHHLYLIVRTEPTMTGTENKEPSKNIMDAKIACAVCGSQGPFSRRQQKIALRFEPAKCVACAEKAIPVHQKKKAKVEEKSESTEKNSKKKKKERTEKRAKPSLEQHAQEKTKEKAADKEEATDKVYFSDGGSVSNKSTSSSSASGKKKEYESNPSRRSRKHQIAEKKHAFSDDESAGRGEGQMEVSLDELKSEIMGRKIQSSEPKDDGFLDNVPGKADLKRELMCPICHDCLYQPVSLQCGHSFCQECLRWWLSQEHTKNFGKCPTCRRGLTCHGASLSVNTALRACVTALFTEDLQARIKSQSKLTAGEDEGAHSRGYEVLSRIELEEWSKLRCGAKKLATRRSIVLDAQDQRMQLALAFQGDPVYSEGRLSLELCILHMEEDEATDGDGFPIVLRQEDDEHLICRDDDRIQGCVDVTSKSAVSGGTVVPVSRRGIGDGASVSFDIDADSLRDAALLCFRHEETGAVLEIKLPLGGKGKDPVPRSEDEEDSEDEHVQEGNLEDDDNDEEDAHSDEFEDDGFVVGDNSVDESAHDDESDVEDADECNICRDGGELMICDGGDEMAGCEKSFHTNCVGRMVTPEGDWVCQSCANAFGMDVGLEGHEFKSDAPEAEKGRLKRKRNTLMDDSDDSGDDEFGDNGNEKDVKSFGDESDASLNAKPKAKIRKTIAIVDSDDED